MKCTRCNVAHTHEHPLVASEHGLICEGCVRAVEAVFAVRGSLGVTLFDENMYVIIDPAYNPYEEIRHGPATHYLSDAFNAVIKEMLRPVVDANAKERIDG